MILNKIRKGQLGKSLAVYIALQLLLQIFYPTTIWALTGGPKQPEFNSFTPIGTSDMVDLSSGDFNYNIPIMDVGGYPLNLSYQSGITMDQEASWVGLGWNLNVGQINRNVRGIPDDFKGDEMKTEANIRDNVTVNVSGNIDGQIFGLEKIDQVGAGFVKDVSSGGLSLGVSLTYNNYTGISFKPSFGLSFKMSENVGVGIDFTGSATEGASVSPNLNLKTGLFKGKGGVLKGSLNFGVNYNSSRGLSDFNMSSGLSFNQKGMKVGKHTLNGRIGNSSSGSISFANTTLTPRKRTAFIDRSGTTSISLGTSIYGVDVEGEVSASSTIQKIKDPIKVEKAYGYEFTGLASKEDILDYNRENDQLISKTTKALAVTNYTYDTYTVQGQGVGGQFRPFRSQVGHIYDEYVEDKSESASYGLEAEGGAGFHIGKNKTKTRSRTYTGLWNTKAVKYFKNDQGNGDTGDYEPVYFKYIGESRPDRDLELFRNKLGGYHPIALKIGTIGFDKPAENIFKQKISHPDNPVATYQDLPKINNSDELKRRNRDYRNTNIQKVSRKELVSFYNKKYYDEWSLRNSESYIKEHHTVEMRVQQTDGSHYIYGEPAYNKNKVEATFAVDYEGDCAKGLVEYFSGLDDSAYNESGIDHYSSVLETPAYAHSYLLTSVLSSDYEDLTGDGPSYDDLGNYTHFEYFKPNNADYRWRIPFKQAYASFDEGLNTNKSDQKGSYVYGEKEIKYLKRIETKTHVAILSLSAREDGKGVYSREGGLDRAMSMYKIDKISLFARPQAEAAGLLTTNLKDLDALLPNLDPIKVAHFEYDYQLCPGVPNQVNRNQGKLTLRKVYFTYRKSQMGKHTPYVFNYAEDVNGNYDEALNPRYNLKAYDIWGNYKPNEAQCGDNTKLTAPEFPFVQQDSKDLQDLRAKAWSLSSINLPSGGKIKLEYETDDYQYVQNRAALKMFKVVGVGNAGQITSGNNRLYSGPTSGDAQYVFIKLDNPVRSISDFKEKYFRKIQGKPIYFRFFMNMTKHGYSSESSKDYDYVTGYFNSDAEPILSSSKDYAGIPMKFVKMEGGLLGGSNINPITKSGLYFARQYLNSQSLGIEADRRNQDIESIAKSIVKSFQSFSDLLTGPNRKLRSSEYSVAKKFIPEKSWIRLSVPNKRKFGGGLRVKKLSMHDNWGKILKENTNEDSYSQVYGQTYNYNLDDGTTSGVATFEPNMSKENPFVEPFYADDDGLLAPKEENYIEKPFGASFFPGAKITYSQVTVANLVHNGITKHATGKVVHNFYTSKDFPTKVDYTEIDGPKHFSTTEGNILGDLLKGIVGASIKNRKTYTLSQGFMIHTNDMDGKSKSQKIFAEDEKEPISSVHYEYGVKEGEIGELDNKVKLIDEKGLITKDKEVGVDYDVVLDFRESYSGTTIKGFSANLAGIPIPCTPPFTLVVPSAFPKNISHLNKAHSVITTKHIHTTAIMKKKIAIDLGATVTTTNEAWDANTGQILLTKTINEYDDHYYNLNIPAYWGYQNMGLAVRNIGVEGVLQPFGSEGYFRFKNQDTNKLLTPGDEIRAKVGTKTMRLWVVGKNNDGSGVLLMNRLGDVINKPASEQDGLNNNFISIKEEFRFKIIRSGFRNQQQANMSSITTLKNPLFSSTGEELLRLQTPITGNETNAAQTKVINASAISYVDFWNCQCERGLPSVPYDPSTGDIENIGIHQYKFNPYLFNAKGDWRADKSYAYLSERVNIYASQQLNHKVDTRKQGFFKDFIPYYSLNEATGKWNTAPIATNKWTFASEVTQYSPYGVELENKDALDRYSSAQYGYNYTLPTAVSSNSNYTTMGVDNMEDYSFVANLDRRFDYLREGEVAEEHFNFKKATNDDGEGGVQISDKTAHTGFLSLEVPKSDEARFKRPLRGQIAREEPDFDGDGFTDDKDLCPFIYNSSNGEDFDYDKDGIGNACDDDAVPRITNVHITPQQTYRIKHGEFIVQGNPNDTVRYKAIVENRYSRGHYLTVNGVRTVNFELYGEVYLDVAGRAKIELSFQAKRAKNNKQKGRGLVAISLLNKFSDQVVFINGQEQTVRICPYTYKKKRSGDGDTGDPEWKCDQYSKL